MVYLLIATAGLTVRAVGRCLSLIYFVVYVKPDLSAL